MPTPATPVMIGSSAAHADRNTSNRINKRSEDADHVAGASATSLRERGIPGLDAQVCVADALRESFASPACFVELKMTVAYAVWPSLAISAAPAV